MRRSVALTFVLALLAPAAASAAPGDPIATPIAPADGATVTPTAEGVALTFGCPPYRQSPSSTEPGSDSIVGYGVQISTDPSFGRDIASTTTIEPTGTPGECTAFAQQLGGGPLTEPGTYHWRVTRFCFCGETESEDGPSASFTIRPAKAKLRATGPKRAFAGFPFLVSLRTDLPDGEEVRLQRRDGKAWKAVGKAVEVSDGRASAPIELARGKAEIRWTAGPNRSRPLAITVAPARGFSTGAADDGAYRADGKANVTFDVADGGREIRDLKAGLTVYCIGGPDISDNRVVAATTAVKRIRIAPDGRFYSETTISKTDTVVSGRLKDGRLVGGRLELAYPLCSGAIDFTARKR